MMDISLIIPIYNEEGNLERLYKELKEVMDSLNRDYEIIFINDGSTDNSSTILNEISNHDKRVRIIHFDKNYGKTSALDAGFRYANGNYILTIDADLQIKTIELARVYRELENCDVVIGWRRNRIKADGFIKTVSSRIANFVRNFVLKENFHDAGCHLRGFRRSCIKDLLLYDNFECFIFSLLKIKGFHIKEINVKAYPRIYGRSKYNTRNRMWRSLIALLIVRWMQKNRFRYKIAEVIENKG